MGIFGEKCVRCGGRTRDSLDGQPTCEPCQRELRMLLEAAKEGERRCPVDASALHKEVAGGVVIDRCNDCGGVWLDRGELEHLSRNAAMGAIGAIVAPFPR